MINLPLTFTVGSENSAAGGLTLATTLKMDTEIQVKCTRWWQSLLSSPPSRATWRIRNVSASPCPEFVCFSKWLLLAEPFIPSLTKNFNCSLFFHSVGCIRAFSHTKSGPFESNSIIIRKAFHFSVFIYISMDLWVLGFFVPWIIIYYYYYLFWCSKYLRLDEIL